MVRGGFFWVFVVLAGVGLSAQARQPAVPALAVSDFTGDNPSLCQVVTETVLTDLAKSRRITLVERAQLREALNELRLHKSGLVGLNEMASAGRLIGATHVVVGSVGVNEGRVILNARVIDVRTGALYAGAGENTEGWSDELFGLAHELANRLHYRLTGEPLPGYPEPASSAQSANRSEAEPVLAVPPPAPDWANLPETPAIANALGKGWMRLFADGSFRPWETVSERYFYETLRRFARRYQLNDAHLFPHAAGDSALSRLKAVRIADTLFGRPSAYFLDVPEWAGQWLTKGVHKPLTRAQFAELLYLLEEQAQRAITPIASSSSVSALGR